MQKIMQIILLAKDNKCEGKAETLNVSHNQQQLHNNIYDDDKKYKEETCITYV